MARIDAKGGIKHMRWTRRGELASYTDCSGKTTHYGYGLFGHLAEVTNALEETVRYKRLATGQVLEVELPWSIKKTIEPLKRYTTPMEVATETRGVAVLDVVNK